MSSTDETIDERRGRTSPRQREIAGVLRRMELRVTDGAMWQVIGHLLLDSKTKESLEVEPFINVGFYARPPVGTNAEAIVGFIAGYQSPVILGTRDEDTRKQVAQIAQDEAIAYNTKAVLHIDKDGNIHARLANGTTRKLAFADEVNNLRAFTMQQFSGVGHGHPAPGGATTGTVPIVTPVSAPATAYLGTSVLKGQ